jgi:serine-type D-Ala-D-Ala carboxypeptidase/endopeptidase (penicillin-binding protein 4)
MKKTLRCCLLGVLASVLTISGCTSTRYTPARLHSTEMLRQQIDTVLADSVFRPVVTMLKIVSLKTSEVLYERNAQLLMRPASNMKLITSATALLRLGRDFKFTTRMFSDGPITDSVLHGNLYIHGSGDPDFLSSTLADMTAQVRAKGIASIEGDIIGDASYFDEKRWGVGWMWDDEPSSDEAFNSALSINRNCIDVLAAPADTIGGPPVVALDPVTRYMTIENTATTGAPLSGNTLEISRKYFERTNIITVKGSIPLGAPRKKETVTVLGPEQYCVTLLQEELQRQQVRLTGTAHLGAVPAGAQLIAQHDQPMDSMVVFMNKVSDNLSAENTLKTVSAEVLGYAGSSEHGISLVKQTLAGFNIDSTAFLMVDGSGVSHYNLLTPDIYIKLLDGMYRKKDIFDLYYASLPIAGVDGTLSKRMLGTAAQNNMHAKTGTISGVSTLSGYVTTADGELLAFSMMMQNYIGSSRPFHRAQDAIGALMANFRREAE